MKFLLMPDSFKGTMSSETVCGIMEAAVLKRFPGAQVLSIPIADGGEGSVSCFLSALGGKKKYMKVSGPFGEPVNVYYGLLQDGSTAVIEMAEAAGLPLVKGRKNPLVTTTTGVGEMIQDAAENGAKKIILGLGGSATNDGGCGAASAIGVRFYNENNEAFIPTGGTLSKICRIDMQNRRLPDDVEIIAMCDIDNPMYGENGAAYVFGPQKGADASMVQLLDFGLVHLAKAIETATGKDISHIPGTGAAGAMGAGMLAFFNARLQMGIDAVLDTVCFETVAKDADYIFTGEGRIDSQSLRGKAVLGISRRAKKLGIPVIAVTGAVGDGIGEAYSQGVTAIFSINREPAVFEDACRQSEGNLALQMDNILRILNITE